MTLLLRNIAATFQHTQSGSLHREAGKHDHWKLANLLMMCACLPVRCIYINLMVWELNFLFEQLGGDSLSGQTPGKPLSYSDSTAASVCVPFPLCPQKGRV